MAWISVVRNCVIAGAIGFFLLLHVDALAYEVSAPGLDLILRGDLKKGAAKLERAARSGDARAAFLVFAMHYSGYGVPKNLKKARDWLDLSKRRPISESLYAYGMGHYKGIVLNKDLKKAFSFFKKAANKGHPGGQFFVGKMQMQGTGTRKNMAEGVAAMQRASKQGSVYAMYDLSQLLKAKGAKHKNAYLQILRLSAITGFRQAQTQLHRNYYKGDGVLQDYKLALYWGRLAAGQGAKSLFNSVGYMYGNGKGAKKNSSEALLWYRRSAESGSPTGAYNMGVIYRNGAGVKRNYVLAHMWYNLAASRGNKSAIAARDRLAKKMRAKHIELAQRLARNWQPKRSLKSLKFKSSGTGFFVNLSHWVVTNEHVISGCVKLAVRYKGRIWRNVSIIAARKDVDLALLQVKTAKGQTFTHGIAAIAPPDDAPLGEAVSIYGYPWSSVLASDGVFSTGILNAHAGVRNNKNFIQISAPIQPGNSGSAVYDEKGRVIGIVSSSLKPINRKLPQNVNFAVKGSVLKKMINAFHTPSYSFDEKKAPVLSIKGRARVAKRNSAHVLCYGYK